MKNFLWVIASIGFGVVATGFGLWVITLAGHFKGF
ncbi:hypothetical protein CPT_Sushi32 [Klebsiella phage Sushi]|jgi:hypothetical protein|uniref:Uncharacterized protein n=4 Tax=Drexlerviridae TaxID=2731691 RepID=A0A6B9LSB5_9CAUD|nr:hypothetical protein AVT24_gp32 [Klebsiella phage Sushi]QBZ71187.1 putative integral membrane protein [Klebsiella phage Sanco]QHB49616.1 hypothetical protein [Klebsiella phage PhiKpNIH-10]WDQ26569.1 hypothetical protein phiKPNHS32_00029 [Klebsiella phage phi_KPN_HS3]CAK6596921.1 hypothetical protein K2064PH2_LOCUS35 [Klebsiella phage vB_Kpn_K2064PH2]AKQ07503.1 hypothetical protein CPT_Sushi32 [Klebsiella phage Sushi]